ncbi:hypothetical protein JN00_0551 [Metamycoplasma subdolum]|uniref:Uncharacterized protein n=1 Tax=Metamycoplasma subdolum TaxID=92407 RepID=A0A3L9ZX47_9BACT|nr:hypothetical protein [Metamycoplasma subdolum]RMA77441.1 hypothetical protein JN00_0551 [Metamycoplasma subdolum]WPB50330.1 hypothetical protein R9C05_01840 [Metamycoplasma subdolum]
MLPQDAVIQKNETERVDYFIKQNSHKISQITPYLKHNIKDYIKYLELKIFSYNEKTNYEIEDIKFVCDNFKNPYVLAVFKPIGYMLVSLINNECVVVDMFAENKKFNDFYFTRNSNRMVNFDLDTFRITNNEVRSLENNQKDNYILKNLKTYFVNINETLNNKKLNNNKKMAAKVSWMTKSVINSDGYNYDPLYRFFIAEKEVPHAWWFKLAEIAESFGYQEQKTLKEHYSKLAENEHNPELKAMYEWRITKCEEFIDTGLCHYIGLGMLLLYAEFFKNYGVFSDLQVKKYLKNKENQPIYDFFNKPKPPIVTEDFVGDLWLKYGKGAIFTTSLYMKQVVQAFEGDRKNPNEEWPISVHRRSAGWIKPWKWIRDGHPCLVFGTGIPKFSISNANSRSISDLKSGHGVVVYGTHENGRKMLCHYGWARHSQVLLSKNLAGQLWLVGLKEWGKVREPRKHFTWKDGRKTSGWETN